MNIYIQDVLQFNVKKYQKIPKWVLDCYDVKNSQKRWRCCVLKKKQSKKVKKHITIKNKNINNTIIAVLIFYVTQKIIKKNNKNVLLIIVGQSKMAKNDPKILELIKKSIEIAER